MCVCVYSFWWETVKKHEMGVKGREGGRDGEFHHFSFIIIIFFFRGEERAIKQEIFANMF